MADEIRLTRIESDVNGNSRFITTDWDKLPGDPKTSPRVLKSRTASAVARLRTKSNRASCFKVRNPRFVTISNTLPKAGTTTLVAALNPEQQNSTTWQ